MYICKQNLENDENIPIWRSFGNIATDVCFVQIVSRMYNCITILKGNVLLRLWNSSTPTVALKYIF